MSFTETDDEEAESIILPRAPQPLVSILITTTSQASLLARCLKSLALHLENEIACEVIIVMNAATDEVKALVRQTRGILVADSPANLGVAGGYNRARSLAKGKYLILLHDDTEITPYWLGALVEAAEAHREAGAVASMIFHLGGAPQIAGAILWQNAHTSPPWGSAEAKPEDYNQMKPVDYSGTCSLLVRADTWDAIHGLDEDIYPAYYVDVDLSMSIRKQGQIVLFTPHSRVFHHRGASSNLSFRQFMAERNRAVFMVKWSEELQGYEAYAPHDPAALKRAQARTEQVASLLKERWSTRTAPPSQPLAASLDTISQDLAHLQRERSLHRAYNATIAARCAELEAQCQQGATDLRDSQTAHGLVEQELRLKKKELAELKSKHTALKEKIRSIEKTRWWSWRQKFRKILGQP